MNNKTITLLGIFLTLGGCASQVERPGQTAETLDIVDPDEIVGSDTPVIVLPAQQAAQTPRVEFAITGIDFAGDMIELGACEMFHVAAGSASNDGGHAPAFHGDGPVGTASPSCVTDRSEVARLQLAENSESAILVDSPDNTGYLVQVTTGAATDGDDMASYHLMSAGELDAAHASADLVRDPLASAVLVQTPVDGMDVELLIDGTEQGPDAIYLDADGKAGSDNSVAGGWVLFPSVSQGQHLVSYGHAELDCGQMQSLGWAGHDEGTSSVMAMSGATSLVNGIGCY